MVGAHHTAGINKIAVGALPEHGRGALFLLRITQYIPHDREP